MKKEDILQKARREGNNEYEQQRYDRIMRRSALAVFALCAFFWLARSIRAGMAGLADGAFELPAIVTGYAAFIELWTWHRLRGRMQLVCGLLFLAGFVIFTARFFLPM